MRPSRVLWNLGVKAPAKVARFLIDWELQSRRFERFANPIVEAHKRAQLGEDRGPPPFGGRGPTWRVDILPDEDDWAVSLIGEPRPLPDGSAQHFGVLENLTPGKPVLVTLQLETNDDVAVYVDGVQVSVYSRILDVIPEVFRDWMRELDKLRIVPRFRGVAIKHKGEHGLAYFIPADPFDSYPPRKLKRTLRRGGGANRKT